MAIFADGQCLIVTTRGPGTLNLLTYNPITSTLQNCNGSLSTTSTGVTRFLISFSHNYQSFAFMWNGAGEAVYSIGTGLQRTSVGRNWSQASLVEWGSSTVTTADVTGILPSAVDRTNLTTIFIIPDLT
ncbi:hypothetical protein JOM56_010027 [Amanita muscaria]